MGTCLTKLYYNLSFTAPYNEMIFIDCEKGLHYRGHTYDSDTDSTDSIIIHEGEFDSFLYGNKNE